MKQLKLKVSPISEKEFISFLAHSRYRKSKGIMIKRGSALEEHLRSKCSIVYSFHCELYRAH